MQALETIYYPSVEQCRSIDLWECLSLSYLYYCSLLDRAIKMYGWKLEVKDAQIATILVKWHWRFMACSLTEDAEQDKKLCAAEKCAFWLSFCFAFNSFNLWLIFCFCFFNNCGMTRKKYYGRAEQSKYYSKQYFNLCESKTALAFLPVRAALHLELFPE